MPHRGRAVLIAPDDPSPRVRRAGLAAFAALVLAALGSLGFQGMRLARVPSRGDDDAVAARIRAAARPGDAVLLVPLWAERPRLALRGGPPVFSLPAGDPDLGRVGRLWVVAFPDLPFTGVDAELARLRGRFGAPKVDAEVGRLRLLRFDLPPQPPRWHFRDHLRAAQVTLDARPCPWTTGGGQEPRFQCARAPWNYVGAEIREIDYLPRRCIWAHPATRVPLVIRFPTAPHAGTLVVHGGLVGESALRPHLAPVHLEAYAGDRDLGGLTVPPRPGWFERRLPLPGGDPGPVRFVVSTPSDGDRHFCFDAWVRGAPGGHAP